MLRAGWVIGFNTPLSEKISRRTLSGCDWKGLLELIEDVRARVSREMGRAVAVLMVIYVPILPTMAASCGMRTRKASTALSMVSRPVAAPWTGQVQLLSAACSMLVRDMDSGAVRPEMCC